MTEETRAGYVSIIGKPNVGKSTLLNRSLGTKLSITSRRPQTTQHQIVGILTQSTSQFVFIDTPGINASQKLKSHTLQSYITKQALSVLESVDVILHVMDATNLSTADVEISSRIKNAGPAIGVLNKTDRLSDKAQLLPMMAALIEHQTYLALVPISARSGEGIEELLEEIKHRLPHGEFLFNEDELTTRSTRFLTSELIREQIFRQMGDELPYQTAVVVDRFHQDEKSVEIHASIFVERPSQKGMIVGQRGKRLKAIGSEARKGIAKLVGVPCSLYLHVRVSSNWTKNEAQISQFGFE